MERTACVDVPALPLQLLLRERPEWEGHPAAVVDRERIQGRILWVNGRARALGVLPGMRYGAALALSSNLRADVVSGPSIEEAVVSLASRLRRLAPGVEASRDEPGVFWLAASGLSRLYPRLGEWARLIRDEVAGGGLRCSVAVGFSRFGSYASAKGCERVVVFRTPEEEEAGIRGVPLHRLDLTPRVRQLLARLGIHTLGGFLDLPPSGIRSRLGRQAYRLHRLASGDLASPLRPDPPAEPAAAGISLDHAESDRGRLLLLMEKLLAPLLKVLQGRHEVMASLHLTLHLDDSSRRNSTLRPAEPTLDGTQLLELLRLRMEATALPAGVTDIRMELGGVRPGDRQEELFRKASARDLGAANRALAQLRARFEGGVLRACLRPGHLPEARFTWETMEAVPLPRPRRIQLRPLVRRFFPRPVRLPRTSAVPNGAALRAERGGAVHESAGPYILSGGWWGSGAHREYHFVRTGEGPWLWIYYDRKREGWFLHGKVE